MSGKVRFTTSAVSSEGEHGIISLPGNVFDVPGALTVIVYSPALVWPRDREK